MTQAEFAALVGTPFVTEDGHTFILDSVEALSHTRTGHAPPFALRFTGPAGLPQRLYTFRGGLQIFIVPTASAAYLATFN